ncbi:MAG: AAA family ATPase [Chloroflexi bacterium]|nr:AAA family ATPase [Chloroflexota bacterium]
MILQRLSVRDFRRFDHFEATFGPGVNVILGNNEEGKSTLREAITVALFESPETDNRKILGLRRWGATQRFAVVLEFEEEGKSYRLTKDFQARSARLETLESGETIEDVRAIRTRIGEMLGLGSRATFESTVRISQQDITRIQKGQEIADSLARLMTGGEQDVHISKVLSDLDTALKGLSTKGAVNTGPLVALPKQIESKRKTCDDKLVSLQQVEKAKVDLLLAEQELKAVQKTLQEKEALEAKVGERLELEDEHKKAREEAERLEALVEQIRSLERSIESDQTELGRERAVLAVSTTDVAVLEAEAASGETEGESRGTSTSGKVSPAPRWGLIVAGVLLVGLGLIGGLSFPPLFILMIAGLGIIAWGLWQPRHDANDASMLAASLMAEERKAKAEKAAVRLQGLLSTAGCASAAEFRTRRAHAEQLHRRIGEASAGLGGILGGRTTAEIDNDRRAASRKVRNLAERLDEPAMRLANMDLTAYQRLQQEIRDLREDTIKSLKGRIEDRRVTVRASQANVDDVNTLEEEIQDLTDRLAAVQEREAVLKTARDVLAEARTAAMVPASDILAEKLGALVEDITRGRYSRVQVDAAGLGIQVVSPERGEPIRVALDGELSTGTVEQVYLAARIAIAGLLAQNRRPPLILDDPFVTFDPPRTRAVMELCRRLSTENQILLFTCDDVYRAIADQIIELPSLPPAVGQPEVAVIQ